MTYDVFIHKFVHPFIVYVLIGSLVSYLLALLMVQFAVIRNARSKAFLYILPFIIPLAAYIAYRPFIIDRCTVYGHPLGVFNDWLCYSAEVLATILTPLFLVVVFLAVIKAFISIAAGKKIAKRYGFARAEEYPVLFNIMEKLCLKGDITKPGIIVTPDSFARSFTMGYRLPVIVVSKGLLDVLDAEELETVAAHELGHIARADSVTTWAMVFLRDLLFFTPVIFWVFRDFITEKEKAADDMVVRLTGRPMAFAQALIKVWRLSPKKFLDNIVFDNFMPHPNLLGQAGVIEFRVRRMLDHDPGKFKDYLPGYIAALIISTITMFTLFYVC